MTYREDLIFVTHMKFDFSSGEERRGIITIHTRASLFKSTCAFENMHACMCVIILLVCKVKGNKDNGDLTQEGQIDHPSFSLSLSLISVFKCPDLFFVLCLTIKHSLNHHITSRFCRLFIINNGGRIVCVSRRWLSFDPLREKEKRNTYTLTNCFTPTNCRWAERQV